MNQVPRRTHQAGHHEQRILQRLQGVAGCGRPPGPEVRGVPLSEAGFLGAVDLERFLAVAESLARLVAAIHERGVYCRNLTPDNVRVSIESMSVTFADFTQASSFAEDPAEEGGRAVSAYTSPEMTARR